MKAVIIPFIPIGATPPTFSYYSMCIVAFNCEKLIIQ